MFSILGSLLGFASSTIPSIIDIWKTKQQNSHQLKVMELSAKYKVQEQEAKTDTAEVAGVYSHAESLTARASIWAVTLSSTVRPISAYLIITLWLSVKLLAVLQVYFDGGEIHKVIDSIYTEYDQMLMSSVICFYFGSRGMEKIRK